MRFRACLVLLISTTLRRTRTTTGHGWALHGIQPAPGNGRFAADSAWLSARFSATCRNLRCHHNCKSKKTRRWYAELSIRPRLGVPMAEPDSWLTEDCPLLILSRAIRRWLADLPKA